jgi:hypothetical protein
MRTASILLLLLLVLFGSLYFGCSTYKDLWANLFAAVITVLLIDRIVERSEIQRNERSIRYAKGHAANVCTQLMWRLRPPRDWKERIKQENPEWKDYFQTISILRTESMDRIERFLGSYSNLVDSKFRNDLFDILNLLNSGSWNTPYLNIENKTDMICLGFLIHDIVAIINLSLKMVKKHELLRYMGLGLRWKEGEPDTIDEPGIGDIGIKQNISDFENWLRESIEFRDKILELSFPSEQKKSE